MYNLDSWEKQRKSPAFSLVASIPCRDLFCAQYRTKCDVLFLPFMQLSEGICMKMKLLSVQCPWFLQSVHSMKSLPAVYKIKIISSE